MRLWFLFGVVHYIIHHKNFYHINKILGVEMKIGDCVDRRILIRSVSKVDSLLNIKSLIERMNYCNLDSKLGCNQLVLDENS